MVNGELQIPSNLIKMETSGFYLSPDTPSPRNTPAPMPSPNHKQPRAGAGNATAKPNVAVENITGSAGHKTVNRRELDVNF